MNDSESAVADCCEASFSAQNIKTIVENMRSTSPDDALPVRIIFTNCFKYDKSSRPATGVRRLRVWLQFN